MVFLDYLDVIAVNCGATSFVDPSAIMSTFALFIFLLALYIAGLSFSINRLFGITSYRQGKRLLIWIAESVSMYFFLAVIAYWLATRVGVEFFSRRRPEKYARAIRPSGRLSASRHQCGRCERRSDLKTDARGLCLSRNDGRLSRGEASARRKLS